MKPLYSLFTLTAALPMLVHADSSGSDTQTSRRAKKPAAPETPKAADAKVNQGPFVTGDFLYWIASEEGLEYAVSGVTFAGGGSTNAVTQGKTREPEFEYGPGFRLGIGYTLPKRNWDAGVYWTRYHTDVHDQHTAAHPILTSNRLYPILDLPSVSLGGAAAPLDAASVKLNLRYDALDFLLGREFRVNDYFSVRPFGGVRFAWIDQHYRVTYAAQTSFPADPLHKLKLDNDFFGAGIRTGIDAFWECHRLVSIFAKAGMTIFNGSFDIHQFYQNAASATIYGALHDREIRRVVSEFDTALGLRLQLGPCGRLKRCELNAAYEFVLYPKQFETLYFMDDTKAGISMRQRGDLSFQGLTLGANLYF